MDKANVWTIRKWDYLKKYLHAYTTIVSCYFRDFTYVDMFAGKGKYDGKDGSPIIALKLEFPFTNYIFVEKESKKLKELEGYTSEFLNREAIVLRKTKNEHKKPIDIKTENIEAKNYIKNKLDEMPRSPCFILLDPYGIEEMDMTSVKLCSQKKKVELLINFSVMGVIRNADRKQCHPLLTQYYGTEEWKNVPHNTINRGDLYAELYIKSLKEFFDYILYKVIKNEKNAPIYYLIYATNNDKGYKIMKDVMNIKSEQSKLNHFKIYATK